LRNITVYFDDETIRYKRNIEMAMKMVNSIGGGHSKGFGRLRFNGRKFN